MMAKDFNKRLSSFTFSLQKAYEKLLTAKPSLFIISIVVVGATVFLLGGGVYDFLVKPLVAFISQSGEVLAFYPGLNDQFILGSIIVMILYVLGFVGFIIAYRSTKYAYNPRQAYRFLLIGCAMILIAYFLVEQRIVTLFS
jgi:hypothetical protein